MNTVFVSGRLNADPEIKYKENDKGEKILIAKYTLVQSNTKGDGWKTDINFIPCVCFGRIAQIAKDYLKQGKLVTVEGRFQSKLMEKDGEKSFFSNIVVKQQIFELEKSDTKDSYAEGDYNGYKKDG